MNEVCDICTYQIVSLSLVIREGYIVHDYLCRFVFFYVCLCIVVCFMCEWCVYW